MAQARAASGGHAEPHGGGMATRLNWLRAAVLGANDGIVSTAGLVVGVAGASSSRTAIVTAGLAGLFAGALAMASGECVSVSSQRDSERAMLALERRELAESPHAEVAELACIYEAKGLPPELAREVAERLTEHDALAAHAEAELGIDPEQLARPGHAAAASFLSFTAGRVLPLLAITLVPAPARVIVTIIAVLAALVVTGAASAALGRAPRLSAVLRNVLGGGAFGACRAAVVITGRAAVTRCPAAGRLPGRVRHWPLPSSGTGNKRESVLEFDRVVKRFGTLAALDGCSFAVRPGRLTGFLGPNGAGKATAMRAVFGLTVPDAGTVRWSGATVTAAQRARAARAGPLRRRRDWGRLGWLTC